MNIRAISAVVAHLLYTERVGGSNPSSPMINKSLALNWMKKNVSSKMQELQQGVDKFIKTPGLRMLESNVGERG